MKKSVFNFLFLAFGLCACVSKPVANQNNNEREDYVFTFLDLHKISYPKEGENLIDSLLLVHTNTFFWSSNVYKLEVEEIDGKSTAKARVLKNFPQKNWLKRQLFGRRYVKDVNAPSFSSQDASELIKQTDRILNNGGYYKLNDNDVPKANVCLNDGPSFFAIVRVNGKVKKGALETCGAPQVDELVCKIETGKSCQK